MKAQFKKEHIPAVNQPVALFTMSRLSDGSLQYQFFGTDADILGILEYAKIIATDRARINAANSQAQQEIAALLPKK